MNKKYKSLFYDTAAFAISNFASKFLVFLLIPLYTSVLSTEDYGIADLISNTISVLYPILTLNIMESTLRFAFDKEVSKDKVLINSIVFVVTSEIIIMAATPVVRIISNTLYDYWIWFAAIFLGYNLQQILSQYVKGVGKTGVFAVSGVIHTVVLIASNIIGLLFLKLGLTAYLFSMAVGYAAAVLYLCVAGNIRIKSFQLDKKLLKDMLKFSLPTIPNNIAWWISNSSDKYIIIGYLGIAASGIYSVAYKIPSILTLLSNVFVSAWTISAIQNIEDKDRDKFQSVVYKFFNAGNVLVCSILIILSQFLSGVLFAKDFYIAWKCVPLLIVAYLFSCLAGFFASSFRAVKYTKGLLSSTSVGAFANIILNLYFVKEFGVMGAAFTTMIGFALTFYIRSYTVKKVINISFDLKKDSLVYLLLIVQAFVICLEVSFAYVYAVATFAIIMILYREEYSKIIREIIKNVKRIIRKRV